MSAGPEQFQKRLDELKAELVEQGGTVQRAIDSAVDAVFDKDAELARRVIEGDEEIDRVDVRIEKKAVRLVSDIVGAGVPIPEHGLRMIFTIVKVNNEFERVADLAVTIAERVESFAHLTTPPPAKFRVMANSVIGIMHNTTTAFAHMDNDAAQLVLATDDATEAFAEAIRRDVAESLAKGEIEVEFAFALNRVGGALARIADHCTNVAEQTIYVTTGKIVRHMGDKWTAPTEPDIDDEEV